MSLSLNSATNKRPILSSFFPFLLSVFSKMQLPNYNIACAFNYFYSDIYSALFITEILPLSIFRTTSASSAKCLLWVTTITHFPSSCAVFFKRAMISSAVVSSRFPVGSSASSIFASLAKALAITTLYCCPPDN